MARHEFSCDGFTEIATERYEGRRPATVGTIVVEPPLQVGEGFSDVVLGRDQNGVHLTHVFSTEGTSVFNVEAALYDQPTHEHMIRLVGHRITKLANNPAFAAGMSQENPFPKPSY